MKMLPNTRCLKITEKGRIQHCERSELRLHFEWTKVYQKIVNFGDFWKPEACGQTVLPDRPVRSILLAQKWVENVKIEKFKCDILGDFQTLWLGSIFIFSFMGIEQKTL